MLKSRIGSGRLVGTDAGQATSAPIVPGRVLQASSRKHRTGFLIVAPVLLAIAILGLIFYIRQSSSIQLLAPITLANPVCGTWQTYLMPSSSQFTSVSVLSKEDAWFVGPNSFARWDGKNVTILPVPNVKADEVMINDAAFRSKDDGWAVGKLLQEGKTKLLYLHWDGNTWTTVPPPLLPVDGVDSDPLLPQKEDTLTSIAIVAENDVWAVGAYARKGISRTLITHWNGLEWEIVPSPNVGNTDSYLTSVVALSEDNVWAFGFTKVGGEAWENQPLTLQWDGTSWNTTDSPATLAEISAASVSPSQDIWAVSLADNVMNLPSNGTSVLGSAIRGWESEWKDIPVPDIDDPALRSLVALSSDDVWAVGSKGGHALVIHWDGKTWSEIPAPNSSGYQGFVDVGAVARGDIWAVGWSSVDEGEPLSQMITHFVGCSSSTK